MTRLASLALLSLLAMPVALPVAAQEDDEGALCVGAAGTCEEVAEAVRTRSPLDLAVTFRFASAILTPAARERLDAFAETIGTQRFARATFAIEGHTDAYGPEAVNQDLSEARAQAVVDYLASRGVPVERMTAAGFGETRPETDDPFDRENRRVEARITLR